MTDERKEGQQDIDERNAYTGAESRGSEALRGKESLLKVIHKAVEAEAIRMGEDTYSVSLASAVAEAVDKWLAAATAERAPLDVAYDAIWKLWDKDPDNQQLALALQAIQRIFPQEKSHDK